MNHSVQDFFHVLILVRQSGRRTAAQAGGLRLPFPGATLTSSDRGIPRRSQASVEI